MRGPRWIIILILLAGVAGVWWYLHRPAGSPSENPAQSEAQAKNSQSRAKSPGGPGGAAGAPVPVVGGTVKKQDVPIYFTVPPTTGTGAPAAPPGPPGLLA